MLVADPLDDPAAVLMVTEQVCGCGEIVADSDALVDPATNDVDRGTGPMLALTVPPSPPELKLTVAEIVCPERTHDTPYTAGGPTAGAGACAGACCWAGCCIWGC